MKKSSNPIAKSLVFNVIFLASLFFLSACDNSAPESEIIESKTEEEAPKTPEIIWNVKAIHPDGQTLDIKAFDDVGTAYDIKAIQNSDQDSFLDVKAIIDGSKNPVKMLVSEDQFAPVKAIDKAGNTYIVKAITAEGEELDVKGVSRFGSVVIIKAITKDGKYYGVKAISPEGKLNDIKGIKINAADREMSLNGHSIHAHVKAMHQAADEDKFKMPSGNRKKRTYESNFERIIWNIKAVTPEGKNLNVKAFDTEGNQFDVKATQDAEQHSFMSIKAFIEGYELHCRVMDSESEYAPVQVIGADGTIYDVKAITENGDKLDVSGVARSGNIIHVKAINENGEFYGVKAFAPDGKLNDVKGIKIFERRVELKSLGHPVYAHLKAISQ